jgi:hypothetical protein
MPSYNYQPLSELEAVNMMLAAIGESPVSTLNDSGDLHVSVATQMLYDVSREIQTSGWHFNTEEEYPLVRNLSGQIIYPPNALFIDASDINPQYDLVMRGTKLYDRKNHTFIFEDNLKVDITFFLPWEELPQAARQYIAIVAARMFQRRIQGDDQINKETSEEETRAKAQLEDFDASTRDYNLADHSDIFNIIAR